MVVGTFEGAVDVGLGRRTADEATFAVLLAD